MWRRSRRRISLLAAAVGSVGAALVVVVVLASPAAADDCGTPEDCEDTGGYNGIIGVVGGGAAVGAAAAAAAAAAAGPDGIEGTADDEEVDLSILQVSENHVVVDRENPAQITLSGWHVGADGELRQVGMELHVEVPPGTGLRVAPLSGVATLTVVIELEEETVLEQVQIQAVGTHKGRTHMEPITVEIGGDYRLEIR